MPETTAPTELLYLNPDVRESFEATVLSIDPEAKTIVLDGTGFYPTGGHQHCDQGRIVRDRSCYAVITDVKMDDAGRVHHTYVALRGNLQPGDRITGEIQWDRRLHHAQLHTSQHLFSRFALDRFGIGTGRADFAPTGGLAVMDEPMDWEQLVLLEDDVNRAIREGHEVTRSLDGEQVTISIDGLDASACRGTHVACTSEIGLFKLTQVDDRVLRYETGEHAKRIATRTGNHALRAAETLELSNTRELSQAVQSLMEERDAARRELDEWRSRTTEREVAKAHGTSTALSLDNTRLLQIDLSHLRAKDARDILKKKLSQDDQLWLCLTERRSVLVSSSAQDLCAKTIVSEFIQRWGIRGGGNGRFAQAGPIPEEIVSPLEEIANWLSKPTATV